jgi:hypothetical protein
MIKGRLTVIALASFIIYWFLLATLFLSIPFMVSWGSAKPWYLKILSFLQDTPLNLTRGNGETKMSFLFVNALFYTLCIAALLWGVACLTDKKGKE